jgi:hypothetical protein
MAQTTPIINLLTYGLPFKLSNQIFNEYQQRAREANFLIDHSGRFILLREQKITINLILALSIFYKRVITNLEAAVKFHGTVKKYSQAETIKIGEYLLDVQERNKILGVTISYKKLIEAYGIDNSIMDYNETKEFLIKMVEFYNRDNAPIDGN